MNKYRVVRNVDHTGKEEFLVEREDYDDYFLKKIWRAVTEYKAREDGWVTNVRVSFPTLQEAINYIKDRMEKEKPIPKPTTEVVWESDNEQEA